MEWASIPVDRQIYSLNPAEAAPAGCGCYYVVSVVAALPSFLPENAH